MLRSGEKVGVAETVTGQIVVNRETISVVTLPILEAQPVTVDAQLVTV